MTSTSASYDDQESDYKIDFRKRGKVLPAPAKHRRPRYARGRNAGPAQINGMQRRRNKHTNW